MGSDAPRGCPRARGILWLFVDSCVAVLHVTEISLLQTRASSAGVSEQLETGNLVQHWPWHLALWLDPKDTKHYFLEPSSKTELKYLLVKTNLSQKKAASPKALDFTLLWTTFHTRKKCCSSITVFLTGFDDDTGCFLHSSQGEPSRNSHLFPPLCWTAL